MNSRHRGYSAGLKAECEGYLVTFDQIAEDPYPHSGLLEGDLLLYFLPHLYNRVIPPFHKGLA